MPGRMRSSTGGSLTVAISVNIDPSEDVLGIQTGSGVSLSAPLANGVTVFVGATAIGTVTSDGSNGHELQIAFNGNATAASASELLHAITYQDTNAADPDTNPRTIRTTVADGDGQVARFSRVLIQPVDDAPVAVASAGGLSYTEGTPVAVDGGLSVSDVDSANL